MPKPMDVPEAATLTTEVVKLVKAASESIQASSQTTPPEKAQGARGGPLQMMGRLYITLVLILGVAASIGAYLDIRANGYVSWTVWVMRIALIASAATGMFLSVLIVIVLYRRNSMMLFSPTEFSAAAQQALIPRSPDQVPPPTLLLQNVVPPVPPNREEENEPAGTDDEGSG